MSQKSLNKILKAYNDKEDNLFYELTIDFIIENKSLQEINLFILHMLYKSRYCVYYSFLREFEKTIKSESTHDIFTCLTSYQRLYMDDSYLFYILSYIKYINSHDMKYGLNQLLYKDNFSSIQIDLISFCFPEYKGILKLLYEK